MEQPGYNQNDLKVAGLKRRASEILNKRKLTLEMVLQLHSKCCAISSLYAWYFLKKAYYLPHGKKTIVRSVP
jgi:hypothetical protein